ncbi:decarboxylase [archaeon]|jgi:ornithine decarboxylase|nr:decarboxylase [archaeon]MBT3731401.1 decarboxylase [archaeon]MBT4670296.1 decarboxylase [archaeon]MBT7052446.1 decarboxylase [archaeon]MBT7281386.1 decarboxylase [archaeon]
MPKFILDKKIVLEKYKEIEEICDLVSYSSKTNSLVTEILEENENCMFSVHLVNELKNIKDLSRVIFLAQGWNEEEIKDLISKKIDNFAVDNERDLDILLKFLENYEGKVNLLLRLKLKEHSLRTEKFFVFGMSSKIINSRVIELKENSKIDKLGVHFHRKTQNMSEWNLKEEISLVLDEECLKSLDYMNIGGGLPSVYANTNVKVVDGIKKKLKDFREWLNNYEIKMIVEPGRFIAAPAVKLVTKVLRIYDNNIIVDASVYNSDMDALIVPVKLLVEGELKKGEGEAYVIKGVTPCSMDLFRYRVYLKDLKEGDEIVFLNAGAYNFSTEFCDLEKIEVETIK